MTSYNRHRVSMVLNEVSQQDVFNFVLLAFTTRRRFVLKSGYSEAGDNPEIIIFQQTSN